MKGGERQKKYKIGDGTGLEHGGYKWEEAGGWGLHTGDHVLACSQAAKCGVGMYPAGSSLGSGFLEGTYGGGRRGVEAEQGAKVGTVGASKRTCLNR